MQYNFQIATITAATREDFDTVDTAVKTLFLTHVFPLAENVSLNAKRLTDGIVELTSCLERRDFVKFAVFSQPTDNGPPSVVVVDVDSDRSYTVCVRRDGKECRFILRLGKA